MSLFGNETSKTANTQLSATDYARALANGSLLNELTLGNAFIVGGASQASAGGAGTALGAGTSAAGTPSNAMLVVLLIIAALLLWLFRKR